MADLVCRTNRKHSSFATKHFQRKSLKTFDLHPPPRRLVSFLARMNMWKVRCWVTDIHTDTHTDTQTKYCNHRCACVPRVNNPQSYSTGICQTVIIMLYKTYICLYRQKNGFWSLQAYLICSFGLYLCIPLAVCLSEIIASENELYSPYTACIHCVSVLILCIL